MTELLPCPFCGKKLVQDKYGNWEHIENDCILSWLDSEYGKIFFGNCEKDIRAWNTRTPDEQPTADAQEVRHGHWIEDKETGCLICSECGRFTDEIIGDMIEQDRKIIHRSMYPFYCSKCGAKMDVEE